MPNDGHDTGAPIDGTHAAEADDSSGSRYRAAIADYAARLGDEQVSSDDAGLRRLEREIADHLVGRDPDDIQRGER